MCLPGGHVWNRSWRQRLFGTPPLLKCDCHRWCWMDRDQANCAHKWSQWWLDQALSHPGPAATEDGPFDLAVWYRKCERCRLIDGTVTDQDPITALEPPSDWPTPVGPKIEPS